MLLASLEMPSKNLNKCSAKYFVYLLFLPYNLNKFSSAQVFGIIPISNFYVLIRLKSPTQVRVGKFTDFIRQFSLQQAIYSEG